MSAPSTIATFDDALAVATQWHGEGRWADAEAVYLAVLAKDPAHPRALHGLGILRFQSGSLDEGWALLVRSSGQLPDDPEVWSNLANAARATERFEEGVHAASRALALRPGFGPALVNRAACLRALHRVSESLVDARAAVAVNPFDPDAWINLGAALAAVGEARASADAFVEAERRAPGRSDAVSNRLFALQYRDDLDAVQLRTSAEAAMASRPATVRRIPASGPLRTIGFVSGDLRRHPVGYFMRPLLEAIDRTRYRIVLFAHQAGDDDLSAELRTRADAWHDLRGLPTESARDLIQQESVDALIDLSGHSAGHRLDVFAARSAPLQATYLGYSATTGLREMDAWLTDAETVPPGAEQQATERIERLEAGAFAFDTARLPAEIPPPPSATNGYVTFGSFNNNLKMSRTCLETWAEILRQSSGTRLLLKDRFFTAAEARERVLAVFDAAGIDRERVELASWLPESDHFASYGRLDIALDTFPYTGATTTVEALAMGVPTVTLAGDRYASRMSTSVLTRIGRPEWVTSSPEAYIEAARGLAEDTERRARERTALRQSLLQSSLGDHERFARSFTDALERLWSRAVSNQ